MAENTELIQINKGIKRLVKLIETSTIVDKVAVNEMRKSRQFAERERDEKGRFVKKEEQIQDDKASLAEKNAEFLTTSKKSWRKQKDDEWKLLKENHKIFKVARAFWQSEAGQAIKNVFSKLKGVFDTILGEIGEFFGQLWGTLKDAFSFVKGTVGSIMDALRGGGKKERREKEQAKDIHSMKEVLTRRQKRALLRKGKKAAGESGLLGKLGLQALFSVSSIVAMMPLILGTLGIGAIVASLGVALWKGFQSYLDGNTVGQIIADALKGLFTITRITGGWLAKLVDLIFGTNIQDWFKKQKWDSFFDTYFPPIIDKIFYTIKDLILEAIEIARDVISGQLQKRIARAIEDWLYENLPEWAGGRKKTAEEKAADKKASEKRLRESMEKTYKSYEGYDLYGQAEKARLKDEESQKKAAIERAEQTKILRAIEKFTKETADRPTNMPAVSMPSPRSSISPGPDLNSQKTGQNNNS